MGVTRNGASSSRFSMARQPVATRRRLECRSLAYSPPPTCPRLKTGPNRLCRTATCLVGAGETESAFTEIGWSNAKVLLGGMDPTTPRSRRIVQSTVTRTHRSRPGWLAFAGMTMAPALGCLSSLTGPRRTPSPGIRASNRNGRAPFALATAGVSDCPDLSCALAPVAASATISAIPNLHMTGFSSCWRDHARNSASAGILSQLRTSRYSVARNVALFHKARLHPKSSKSSGASLRAAASILSSR